MSSTTTSFDPAAEATDPARRVQRIKALVDAAPKAVSADDLQFLKVADPPAYRAMQRRGAKPGRVPRAKDPALRSSDAIGMADVIAAAIDTATEPLHRRDTEHERRLTELERQPRGLTYAGVWQRAATYQRHTGVTHKGALYVAVVDQVQHDEPGMTLSWQLAVKAGRDGRDAV